MQRYRTEEVRDADPAAKSAPFDGFCVVGGTKTPREVPRDIKFFANPDKTWPGLCGNDVNTV